MENVKKSKMCSKQELTIPIAEGNAARKKKKNPAKEFCSQMKVMIKLCG